MTSQSIELQNLAHLMGIASGAKQVILFGSTARGEATANSDLDFLLVLENDADGMKAGLAALEVVPEEIPFDIIPMTERTYQNGSSLLARIVAREGRVLYAR